MKEYIIETKINAPKEVVWKTITNFEDYPSWNSILTMKNNDSLQVGKKFDVTIHKPKGKKSKFKVIALSKNDNKSFSARQKVMGNWFLSATHHFIIEEINKNQVMFIQKWELKGIVISLFKKQIFKELESFNQMNEELKNLLEKE
ncbi:SRPBCC domain-containing protein [Aquimarina sediminis]|uniref:SRPBCC domain-containing protein n=1 Tax=Aquimarina sediminis TaxID=2070536 RepID=UPI000CA01B18|nr:SRPBCC domain-containing protein [Aquimarina sediminis]